MKSKYVLPAVLLLVCLLGGGISLTNNDKPAVAISTAIAAENNEDLLATVRLGCETAASRVSTSSGQVNVHEWLWLSSGELIETDSLHTVASAGDTFRVAVETRYVKNEAPPSQPDSGVQPIAPGTVLRQELAYDGEKVTSYKPAERRAVIAGPDSSAWRDLTQIKLTVMSPGHGVPSLFGTSPSPHYTTSGPYVVGREVVNGDDCIVVEAVDTVTGADGAEVVKYCSRTWISPQRGFTVRKSEMSGRGGIYGDETLLAQAEIETRQYGDGLWGISEARTEQHALDSSGRRYLQLRTITTFADDYQLNAPVTEEMLTIRLPSGTRVHNELIDTEYAVP